MATKITLPDVLSEIEDTLGDLTVKNAELGRMKTDRGGGVKAGYYIQYQISERDVFRAVYLGDGEKPTEMKRKFTAWAMNWRV